MPRCTATLSPMSDLPLSSASRLAASLASSAASASPPSASLVSFTSHFRLQHPAVSAKGLRSLLRAGVAFVMLGTSGFALAQTPVCFDSVGRALPPEQCSQAARNQAAAQAATATEASPTQREECRALADKIANTPDKPVYTRDRPVVQPNGNRIDIPTRTNPRKALKEEYMRKCT